MTRLLQIKSSLFDDPTHQGVSSQLSDELVAALQKQDASLQLTVRDFSRQPVPYLDRDWLLALSTPAAQRSLEQADKIAYSDAVIAQVQAADILVIGVPMYNFAVPAMLKSWTDHLARAGVTFRYTATGPQGLLGNKKVILVMSTGGQHAEGVTDFMRPYLRTILGFMGLNDITEVVAEGLNMGDAPREDGLRKARAQIQNLVGSLATRTGAAA